ncbi:TonB-dependent receptor [Pyrinomonas methylaliphatogenes]|uniref:Outer membrane receptor for ferrienterochelin and colicins n=1 Tax=Pyrinomonas methylaliphatogenes TaxID=454194 RepID=A0A0B6WST4_9BACT|nr:TonB-dependent receptor [Pyrinomonas methylaliphatogenes]CDM64293.1 outer membrane receptor for ferrienterochelin and colicins [Pyrinomonas methylaliphatogenes]
MSYPLERPKVIIILFLAVCSASAQAQTGFLRGRVTDTLGAVVPNAPIMLRNLTTGLERTTTTGADGTFVFAGVREGRYLLTVTASGFAPLSKEIDTIAQEIALTLEPAPLHEQTIVVSGSRQEELRESLNARVEVLTRARIRDTGYETVAEVLRELPGVVTRRGSETAGAAGEQIQGIDSRQVLVLLDGQPLIGARGIKSGIINLDRQSTGKLERIEVVKGAASSLYGSDAIGGVINLITREPSSPIEFSFTSSGGSFGVFDGRGELGFARDRISGYFDFERHKNNGFDLTPTTFDTTGAGFHRYDAYGRLRFQATRTLFLTTFANGYWNRSQGRALGEQGDQINWTDEESQNYGLNAEWQMNARTTVQARGYFARFDEISRGRLAPPLNTALPDGNLFERFGKADATITRIIGERQLLQAGGEWLTDRYRGINRLRDASGERADMRTLWAQDRISLNRLTLILGARYDDHSIFGAAFSPKAGANLRINENLRLRASYGRGFRAPDLGQLYYRFLNPTSFYQVIGNPHLEPEHANSYQLGSEYATRRGSFRFGLNLFRNDVANLIEAVNLGFIATRAQLAAIMAREGIDPSFDPVLNRLLFFYKNVRDARTQGVELDTEIILPRGFAVGGAYTYLDARDETAHLPLTGRHRHQGFVRIAWEAPRRGLRLNLRGTFYSSWIAARSTAGSIVRDTIAPGFALWDVYGAKRLFNTERGTLEVFGAIDNLNDSRDPNTGRLDAQGNPLPIYRPEQGRTFRVGLRYSFASGRK